MNRVSKILTGAFVASTLLTTGCRDKKSDEQFFQDRNAILETIVENQEHPQPFKSQQQVDNERRMLKTDVQIQRVQAAERTAE